MTSVGQRDLFFALLLERKLKLHVLGDYEIDRASINECIGLDGLDIGTLWIRQGKHSTDKTHVFPIIDSCLPKDQT